MDSDLKAPKFGMFKYRSGSELIKNIKYTRITIRIQNDHDKLEKWSNKTQSGQMQSPT